MQMKIRKSAKYMRESLKFNGKRNIEEACRKNAAGRITRMTCLVRGERFDNEILDFRPTYAGSLRIGAQRLQSFRSGTNPRHSLHRLPQRLYRVPRRGVQLLPLHAWHWR